MQLARSKRVEFKSSVLLKKTGLELLCDSRDISVTGIRLATGHKLDLGAIISCQFTLPDMCQIETEAEVVRFNGLSNDKNRTAYGVRFIDLPLTNRNAIAKYVATNNHLGVKQKPHRPLERASSYQLSLS
jgi:c-di-GMP-binding flagellar brake protein YcgR